MSDIEHLVRESMNYDGHLAPLPSEPLIREAHRRRFRRRASAAAVLGVCGIAGGLMVSGLWPHSQPRTVVVDPGESGGATSEVTMLEGTDRVTTPGGAVIVVSPQRLCVGNMHEQPSCLIGVNPRLVLPSYGMAWHTSSPDDFVFAWLTPAGTTEATLRIGDAAPRKAELYQVDGRELLIAVVTGASCWSEQVGAELVSTDNAGSVIYRHQQGDTCLLPEGSRTPS